MNFTPMPTKAGSNEILKRKGYLFEPKLDGIRALLKKDKNEIHLINRRGRDITKDYPSLDFKKRINAKSVTLDGEIVIFDIRGNPSFELLQKYHLGDNPVYITFDILEKNGKNLISIPLSERKIILKQTVKEGINIQVNFFTKNGRKLWEIIKKRGAEGVVAKKEHGLYIQSINDDWIKVKIEKTLDAVIIGYLQKKRKLSSLALGLYDKNKLVYIGNVGTGFSELLIDDLYEKLSKIETEIKDKIHLVRPEYVCEVKYFEVTKDKKLRGPVFLRLRDDKGAKECKTDQLK